MRERRLLAAACALLLVLAGCGSSDHHNTPAAKAQAPAKDHTTETPTTPPPTDALIAKRGVVAEGDLPVDWNALPPTTAKRSKCIDIQRTRNAAAARAASPSFGPGGLTVLTDSVLVFGDESQARSRFAELRSKTAEGCVSDELVRRLLATAAASKTLHLKATGQRPRPPLSGLGDQRAGYQISFVLTAKDLHHKFNVDVWIVRSGRAMSFLVFSDTTAQEEHDIVAKATTRLAAALSGGRAPNAA